MDTGKIRFDRMELAGSLGDLGTLLPLALGMIMINGLPSGGLFLAVGVFYILAGLYYRTPIAVQPMKVIGAYSVAAAIAPIQIQAAGLLVAGFLLLAGLTNFITPLTRIIPRPVVRGVQVSTGLLLTMQGIKFILGTSGFQTARNAAEPFLSVQNLGPVPIGLALGLVFGVLTLLLLDNKRAPAGLVVVLGGIVLGLALGGFARLKEISPGFYLPEFLPFGWPGWDVLVIALTAMALPQIPMTLGNAVMANADLAHSYFPGRSGRVTPRALCLSMGLANLLSFALGGMPLCHGAGGLAAHYRFGARTCGSNLIIGAIFIILALGLGPHNASILRITPLSVLGVLLVFAGLQLCLSLMDMRERKDLFVIFFMAATSLCLNLAWAFGAGILLALALKSDKLSV